MLPERTPDSIRALAAKDDEALYPYWHESHHHHKFPSTGSMDCTTASGTGAGASIPVPTNTTTVTILSTTTVGSVSIRNSSTSSVSSLSYFTVSNSTTVLSTALPSSLGPLSLSSSIGPTGVSGTPIGSSSLLPKYTNSTSPYSVVSSASPSFYTSSSFLYTVTGPAESAMPTPVSTLSNTTLLATSPTLNTSIGAPATSPPSGISYGTIFVFTTTNTSYSGSSSTLPSYYSSGNPPYTNSSSISQSFPTNTVGTTLPYSSGAGFYTSTSVAGLSSDASGALPNYYSSVTPLYTNSSSATTLLSQSATTSTGTAVYTSIAASAGLSSSSSAFLVISSAATAPYTNSSIAESVTLQTPTLIPSIGTISVLTTDILPSSSGIISTIFVTETVISTPNTTITVAATATDSSVSKPHIITTSIIPTSSILKCNAGKYPLSISVALLSRVDNCLRALRATQTPGRLSAAQKFCSTFTKTHDCAIPTYVPWECNSWRLSSACSCIATSSKSEPCPESEMTTTSSHHAWTSSPSIHTTIYYTTTEKVPTKTSSNTPYKLTGWVTPTNYFPHHPELRRSEADQGRERRVCLTVNGLVYQHNKLTTNFRISLAFHSFLMMTERKTIMNEDGTVTRRLRI